MKLSPIALLAMAAAPGAQGIHVDGSLPINVEIDYMVAADHSHEPQPDEIAALVQMFACRGITLNVVVDDAIPETEILQCPDLDQDFWSCLGPQSFLALKTVYFDSPPFGWHYCIFGHQYTVGDGTGSSGRGEIGGDDFIVTLGAWFNQIGSPFDRASTFAHELGHNLGLRHNSPASAGGPSEPLGNFAPNYASVMSYQYQLEGVASQLECLGLVDEHRFRNLDYSAGRLPDLNEAVLSEALGIGIHPVDWNCDGLIWTLPTPQNLDEDAPWCGVGAGSDATLDDWNDWANLADSTWLPADEGEPKWESEPCITYEQTLAMRAAQQSATDGLQDPNACEGSQPSLFVEPCAGDMYWVDASSTGTQDGSGEAPWNEMLEVSTQAQPGSVVYLQPGTIGSVLGLPVVLSTEMVLTGPGTAVIDP